jgi:transposase
MMTLLQDAIALHKSRSALSAKAFEKARDDLESRLDALIFTAPKQADCRRINHRLVRYRFDLLRFLEVADVPPDNNLGERDIRSVAATRSDGGVNRSESGAKAFANIKSIVRTCQKHSRNLLNHLSIHDPLPLPCGTT